MSFKTQHVLVVGLCALVAQGSLAHAETLQEAVNATLSYHPSIQSAKAVTNASEENKRSENSGYYPELSVSSTAGRLYGDNSTSRGLSVTRGAGYSGLWEGSVTASQMLYDGMETPSRVRSASARLQSSDMDLMDVKEALALRATATYINVLRTRTGLSMLQAQKKKVADYLKRIKNGVDEGVSDETEYQQARDVKIILDTFVTDYQGQARAAEAEYMELTGHFPEGELTLPEAAVSLIPETIDDAIAIATENHPTLRAAMFSSEAAAHDITAENAQILPDVNGELSYFKSDKDDVIGGESVDARAVVRLNWNFETGGGQLARIRQKKHQHQEAIGRVQEVSRRIEQGVRVSYSSLQTSEEQLKNQKLREDLNTKLFETYASQYEGARIKLLQLMQADNQRFNTKMEKMSGEFEVLSAQYDVLASIGRLHESLAAPDIEKTGVSSGDVMVDSVKKAEVIQNIEPASGVLLKAPEKKDIKDYSSVEIFDLDP